LRFFVYLLDGFLLGLPKSIAELFGKRRNRLKSLQIAHKQFVYPVACFDEAAPTKKMQF